MNNKFKMLSATVLIFSVVTTVFSSCQAKDSDSQTTAPSTAETAVVHGTDYTYNTSFNTEKEQTEYVHIVPPVPTEYVRDESETKATTTKDETSAVTTKKQVSNGNIEEISNGLILITKTTPVIKGNTATVMIQGAPNAKYTIEFYKSDDKTASGVGLDKTSADTNGFASWTFPIDDDCDSGERKIIIREMNSDKYIQTSITVR